MSVPSAQASPRPKRSERFHRWRRRKDQLARWSVAVGGVGVIGAILLIFFYLLYVVAPLFQSASIEHLAETSPADWQGDASLLVAVEEQREVGFRVDSSGRALFYALPGFETLSSHALPVAGDDAPVLAVTSSDDPELVAVGLSSGAVLLLRHSYEARFGAGAETREIVPSLAFPHGGEPIEMLADGPPRAVAVSDGDTELVVAALGADGRIVVEWGEKATNFLTGETTLTRRSLSTETGLDLTGVAIAGNHRWLYVGDANGLVHRLSLPGLEILQSEASGEGAVTAMRMLLGGISVLTGHENGAIAQWFPVRDESNAYRLERVRDWTLADEPIVSFETEQRRKGFYAFDAGGRYGIFHATAARRVLVDDLPGGRPTAVASSPRSNALLATYPDGHVTLFHVDNPHPEISWKALWGKVWYENYAEPEYTWQSSSASNDFEPKFSLSPLAFGTLKAALYAMLVAVPLALFGAAYTAYFMAPRLRNVVKPTIEIMEALPTVIIGFLAGLWFAPFVEKHLAGIFSVLVLVPPGLLLFAWLWHRYGGALRARLDEGWEAIVMIPVMVALTWFALAFATPLEALLFGGDLRQWLSEDLGISYDQRNALVVGCAMGFAVIPTIFSIAEDAIFSVPRSLSNGSLALGATPWQTMARVILPTASAGIFSALMIGLGRAVGETMIVLMATGNTPVMDWSIFEGMRTLAANIAVEMPESEVGSSHYRILFLAALVLFVFTFMVNTVAELVRQRLREKYSSL